MNGIDFKYYNDILAEYEQNLADLSNEVKDLKKQLDDKNESSKLLEDCEAKLKALKSLVSSYTTKVTNLNVMSTENIDFDDETVNRVQTDLDLSINEIDKLLGKGENELVVYDTPSKKKMMLKETLRITTIALAVGAILLSLKLLGIQMKKERNKNATKGTTSTSSVKSTTSKTTIVTSTTTEPVELLDSFIDIKDSEQVSNRANKILEDLILIDPKNDFTKEEIVNMLNWINGGVVTEVGQEQALFVISRIETIMNKENQREVNKCFDFGLFAQDGSQGQKLLSKISTNRQEMLTSYATDEFQASYNKFFMRLINSWYLMGAKGEISAYALETSGMEALVDKLFLNTISIAQSEKDVAIVIPGYGSFVLSEINKEINKPSCPTIVTAENGESFEVLMNKFSSDMIGMVTEASLNSTDNYSNKLGK